MAVGASSWLAPTFTTRIFGLGSDTTQPIIGQLFGARELALGLATASSSGSRRAEVLKAGVAIDAVDALACLGQIRAGAFTPWAKVATAGGAVLFAGLGVASLRQA